MAREGGYQSIISFPKGGAVAPPFDNPPFLRAALSVIAYSDDTSPKGGGETWLSLWESWQRAALTERAALRGFTKGETGMGAAKTFPFGK